MPGASGSMYPGRPGRLASNSAIAPSRSSGGPAVAAPSDGGTVNIPKRNPPTGGNHVDRGGIQPSSGERGAPSPPPNGWDPGPGGSVGREPSPPLSPRPTPLPRPAWPGPPPPPPI